MKRNSVPLDKLIELLPDNCSKCKKQTESSIFKLAKRRRRKEIVKSVLEQVHVKRVEEY